MQVHVSVVSPLEGVVHAEPELEGEVLASLLRIEGVRFDPGFQGYRFELENLDRVAALLEPLGASVPRFIPRLLKRSRVEENVPVSKPRVSELPRVSDPVPVHEEVDLTREEPVQTPMGCAFQCILASRKSFTLYFQGKRPTKFHTHLVGIGARFVDRHWLIPLERHEEIRVRLTPLCVRFHPLDRATLNALTLSRDEAGHVTAEELSNAYPVPLTLSEHLAPYQRDGVLFILKAGSALLADDMGLGKTVQSLAATVAWGGSALIVCPAGARLNWLREIQTHLGKIVNVNVEEGLEDEEEGDLEDEETVVSEQTKSLDVLVCKSYRDLETVGGSKYVILSPQLVRRVRPEVVRHLKNLIVDESQCLQNAASQQSRAILELAPHFEHRILLSGTPMRNRPMELFPQLQAIDPQTYGSAAKFREQYGHENANRLELHAKLLGSVMIRRTKEAILRDLGEKVRRVEREGVASEELRLGVESLRNLDQRLALELDHTAGRALQTRRLDLCRDLYQRTGMEKSQRVVREIEKALSTHAKVIIFFRHLAVMEAVERGLQVRCVRVDGTLSGEERFRRVELFQESDIRVALLSAAASVSLNLTAASLVMFGEYYYTPSDCLQAEDRVHRIGHVGRTEVVYLHLPGSYDDVILEILDRKMSAIGETMDGVSGRQLIRTVDPEAEMERSFSLAKEDQRLCKHSWLPVGW